MKKDVSTVVISSNQTRVSSSYTYNKKDTKVKSCTLFTVKIVYCANAERVQRFDVNVQACGRDCVLLVPTDT